MGIVSRAGIASLFAAMIAVVYGAGVRSDPSIGPSIVSPPVRLLTMGGRDKPDGSGAHEVERSDLSNKVFYPSWYPDGEQLAVMDAASFSIKKFNLVGGAAATLTDPKRVYTGMPSVSSDGKWIAFAGQMNKGQEYDQTKNSIWVIDETGMPHTLELRPGQGRAPTWSPSGEHLVFESDRASSAGLYAIFLIKRDGTGITQLTDPALNADHPVWSPDGQHIAFSAHGTARLDAARSIGIITWPEDGAARR